MAFRSFFTIRTLLQDAKIRESSFLFEKSRSFYSSGISNVLEHNGRSASFCLYKGHDAFLQRHGSITMTLWSTTAAQSLISLHQTRLLATQANTPPEAKTPSQAKTPPQGQKTGLSVAMVSPGIIYEPYVQRKSIPFWRRLFTRSGWRRTKEDIFMELKSAYAIARLRKSGYSKKLFYKEAIDLYKKINTLHSNGDKTSLRKAVTEKMYSVFKNEIKKRESLGHTVYWELVEPVVKIRTLQGRLIGVDRNDLNKAFIQLTIEFLTKEKFEAYDSKGAVFAGNKSKELLVREIWVFEKSLFHEGSTWRLAGKIKL